MTSRHVREHRREVSWAESQRRCNAQTAAKLAVWQKHVPRRVDLGAGARCMVTKRGTSFSERSAARGAREQLDAEFRFDACELPADD
jgi:hypothetical protein